MTEERFEYNHMEGFKPYIYDVNDNHMVDNLEIICELLNQLSNENEELKSKLNESKKAHSRCGKLWWELHDEKEQLEKEVEQLKKENQELRMSPRIEVTEIEALVCENEQLKSENEELKSNIDDLLNQELDERDIVCQAGKFRLEEWGKHRYHQFYNGDESLEDESVVIMLMEQSKENEQLKQRYDAQRDLYAQLNSDYNNVYDENRELKQLLKEVEHELTTITGLSAFDKCASQLGYVEVFDEDYWELDYSEILQKIDKLKGDVE
ncbi:MAG: hypothetical protein IJL02_04005 [Methanobrevibacter sp.]|uniref:hypothetical protein n=2 Tax=Methanobrevibacter sp. TaxID=66852 RepID=UPI0025CEF338|nr:hypothetical protein [Methanobrevibacter sp.]MBQ6099008.1 hypothetical protein [Methanobrevibacter sp.]